MDGHDGNDEQTGVDRRRAIGLVGAGAAAAWVTPTILSADAAAAATVPPCPMCGTNLVLNGDAESGLMAPWTGGSQFSVTTWADLTTLGMTPLAGTGTNAFWVHGESTSPINTLIEQNVVFGPGCDAAPVTLQAVLGASGGGAGGVSSGIVDLQFYDAADTFLGNLSSGRLSVFADQATPVAPTLMIKSGSMPAGAVSVKIVLGWSGLGTFGANPPTFAVFDNISVTLACP